MAVSNTADLFSSLFNLFVSLAIPVAVVVFGVMVYLIVKYRDKGQAQPEPDDAPSLDKLPSTRGKVKTIVVSVSLSTIILIFLVFGTFSVIDTLETPPPGRTIAVTAKQFTFVFDHLNGTVETGILRVNSGETIILRVTSEDVFHNIKIIDYKISKDAIPGQVNIVWFTAGEPGEFFIQCFEYCGVGHPGMRATLIVS